MLRRSFVPVLLLLLHTTLPAGIARAQAAPPTPQPPTAQTPAPQQAGIQLEAVPFPDLSQLEPAVAEQLKEMQELLAQTVKEGTTPAQLAELFGDLGRTYHAYSLLPPAAACYRNAVVLAPGDYRWPYYLGLLAQQDGDPETAAGHFRRTLALAPGDAPARYRLAECYLALNRPDDAEPLLRELVSQDAGNHAARAALGELALQRGDYAQAVELLEAALAAVPAADRLNYPLGLAYRGLGQADKAREYLAKRGQVGLQPKDPLRDELENAVRGERVYLLRGKLHKGINRADGRE